MHEEEIEKLNERIKSEHGANLFLKRYAMHTFYRFAMSEIKVSKCAIKRKNKAPIFGATWDIGNQPHAISKMTQTDGAYL